MRVLLTWELGLNFGHLTRLLPVAQRLRASGDVVLAAVRDVHAAAVVFGPARIACVQAPHLPQGLPLDHRAAGYSDILLSQGWSDRAALMGLVQAWLNLFQLFRPEKLVLDYSPTASLAARIARIPTVLIGNGFELPPLDEPLRPFPNFSWATPDAAARSEQQAVHNANEVLSFFKAPRLGAARDLFAGAPRLLTTFPELDHYGARPEARYIGALLGDLPIVNRVEWPEGEGPKIFACLRGDTVQVREILSALSSLAARVICVAHGLPSGVSLIDSPHARVSAHPVDLSALRGADLCISYGAEGTMMAFLLAGTPLLISPWHIEAFMSGSKIEAAGLGAILKDKQTAEGIARSISGMCNNGRIRLQVREFSDRAKTTVAENPADAVVAETRSCHGSSDQVTKEEGALNVA